MLRPWTIRPIKARNPALFEPGAFAASVWPRLAREASERATVVSEADASTSQARFVKGTGMVIGVDRESRVGVVRVRLKDSATVVALQIGPVVRGTALRDAAGFISFSDFTNQSDYAAAAAALNDYALRAIVAPLSPDGLKGRALTFVGAVAKSAVRDDGELELVPVHLAIGPEMSK
jgi:predicted lipoprotein